MPAIFSIYDTNNTDTFPNDKSFDDDNSLIGKTPILVTMTYPTCMRAAMNPQISMKKRSLIYEHTTFRSHYQRRTRVLPTTYSKFESSTSFTTATIPGSEPQAVKDPPRPKHTVNPEPSPQDSVKQKSRDENSISKININLSCPKNNEAPRIFTPICFRHSEFDAK
jgi:hypothetical protein